MADARSVTRALADQAIREGDPTGWFEKLYSTAGGDHSQIPWADLAPNPHLLAWQERNRIPANARILVVGCGLGDDAEHFASAGHEVTAFDISPSAISWCRRRFPNSRGRYVVADLLAAPVEWAGAFDLVFEAYTLQALPDALRQPAGAALARLVAPGGAILVICRGRDEHDPPGQLPWPLTPRELAAFERHGLVRESFEDFIEAATTPVRRFRTLYRRA